MVGISSDIVGVIFVSFRNSSVQFQNLPRSQVILASENVRVISFLKNYKHPNFSSKRPIRQIVSHRFGSEQVISTLNKKCRSHSSQSTSRSKNVVVINREPLLSPARYAKVHSRAQAPLKESNRGLPSHSDLECFRHTQAGSDVEEPIGRKCNCGRSSFPAQWRKTYYYVTGRKRCWDMDFRSDKPFADNDNESGL